MNFIGLSAIKILVSIWLLVAPVAALAESDCIPMDLPVQSVGPAPENYRIFCLQYVGACQLEGAPVLAWTEANRSEVEHINSEVNKEIEFVSDWDINGLEDDWDYPHNCQGDCEDFALEKRRRLIKAGYPGASLTIAVGFHIEELFPHAVLLAETSKGTMVLDSFNDAILCWNEVDYRFTQREQPNGQWAVFLRP